MASEHIPMEQIDFFLRFVGVADWAWKAVHGWSPLARDTIGKQLIRAADSVGANLVEGDGRYTDADGLHFFVIARASARETRYWIQRATERHLIKEEEADAQIAALTSAAQQLNRLITYRRGRKKLPTQIKEENSEYTTEESDPF